MNVTRRQTTDRRQTDRRQTDDRPRYGEMCSHRWSRLRSQNVSA